MGHNSQLIGRISICSAHPEIPTNTDPVVAILNYFHYPIHAYYLNFNNRKSHLLLFTVASHLIIFIHGHTPHLSNIPIYPFGHSALVITLDDH